MQIQLEKDTGVREPLEGPGSGRLRLVSGYFRFTGYIGALGTAVMAAQIVAPGFLVRTPPANPFAMTIVSGLITVGFFRTSRLLDERQKSGAWFAILCFIAPLISYLTDSAPSVSTLVLATSGLALVASVWRHLE